jgi:hypothetical protein
VNCDSKGFLKLSFRAVVVFALAITTMMSTKVLITFTTALVAVIVAYPQMTAMAASEACRSETTALANVDATLPVAPECDAAAVAAGKCTSDYTPLNSNFSALCIESGGQFYPVNYTVDCVLVNVTVNFTFVNSPSCYGKSCTADELKVEFDMFQFPAVEKELAELGYVCNASAGNSVYSTFVSLFNVLAVASVLVFM